MLQQGDPAAAVRRLVDEARRAQPSWQETSVRRRLRIVRGFRHLLVAALDEACRSVVIPQRSSTAETLAAEVLPLADACKFLERVAERLLARETLGARRRPLWLFGSRVELHREAHGVVLIVAPANYPLLLPGVQAIQALVAGNAVLVKPGADGRTAAELLARLLVDAGLPPGLIGVLEESVTASRAAIDVGVDHVLVTGSAATGRSVLASLAPRAIPATLELSGCDAVFVREDADIELAAAALRFGMTLNGGYTCIAPRRVFVAHSRHAELERRLHELLHGAPPVPLGMAARLEAQRLIDDALARGARVCVGGAPDGGLMRPTVLADVAADASLLRADVAAPLVGLCAVDGDEQALARAAACPYELGVTIFGGDVGARELASRTRAGVVVVNDMIVPTADPRVPFGGRGQSGYGVTRGAEGLLQLTRIKAVIRRRGRFRPHFDTPGPTEERLLRAWLRAAHSRKHRHRLTGVAELARAAWNTVATARRREGT